MKTRILIIVGIVAVILGIAVLLTSTDVGTGQKYQYKFWQEDMEFEKGHYFTRVLFSRSDDYGRTFSEPTDMSMTKENAHEPKMIVMDDDVILVWRDEVDDDATPNISFAKSTDFGKTFEKKRIFFGARPDIKQYDGVLYMTWAGPDLRQIWYSDSHDKGQTFSDPLLLFEIDWELSPYEPRPTPLLSVDENSVTVSWKMKNMDDGGHTWTNWQAVDDGKDGSFEISTFVTDD